MEIKWLLFPRRSHKEILMEVKKVELGLHAAIYFYFGVFYIFSIRLLRGVMFITSSRVHPFPSLGRSNFAQKWTMCVTILRVSVHSIPIHLIRYHSLCLANTFLKGNIHRYTRLSPRFCCFVGLNISGCFFSTDVSWKWISPKADTVLFSDTRSQTLSQLKGKWDRYCVSKINPKFVLAVQKQDWLMAGYGSWPVMEMWKQGLFLEWVLKTVPLIEGRIWSTAVVLNI